MWFQNFKGLFWLILKLYNKYFSTTTYINLPAGVAMMPPVWAHLPPGQIQGCHLEVTFGRYCKQSENIHLYVEMLFLIHNNRIVSCIKAGLYNGINP